MPKFWIKTTPAPEGMPGDFLDVSYGLVDDNNPAPEGAQIIEADTDAEAQALAELQAQEALEAIISDDSETEDLDQEYKIWALAVNSKLANSDPRGLDYKTGLITSLFAKLSFDKGELLHVEYYRDYDGVDYSDLVLDVGIEYNRNAQGVLTDRTTTRKWAIKDGEFGTHVKTTRKYYSITQAAVADQRRRSNIVDNLVAKADPSVVSFVKTMFRSLDNEINSYKTTGDTSLITAISQYQDDVPWLDAEVVPSVTLRMAIIGQLTV